MQPKEEVLEHFPECRHFEQSLPKKMTRQKSWSTNLGPGFREERLVVQVSGGALTRTSSVARLRTSNLNRENRVDTISRAGHATLLVFFCRASCTTSLRPTQTRRRARAKGDCDAARNS